MAKILVVSQHYWPEDFRLNDLTEILVENKHQVTVLTGQPNYPTGIPFPSYSWWKFSCETYKGIKIYPTAATDFINIAIDAPQQPEVRIYNLNGQLLQRKENDIQQLDISELAAGVYVVEVRNGKDRILQRVLKF